MARRREKVLDGVGRKDAVRPGEEFNRLGRKEKGGKIPFEWAESRKANQLLAGKEDSRWQ